MVMHIDLAPVMSFVHILARAGGGGSSGGGSSGGGGGGSIFFLIGYAAAYWPANWTLHRFGRALAVVVGSICGLIVVVPLLLLHSGFIALLIMFGVVSGVYGAVQTIVGKVLRRATQMKKLTQYASRADAAWDSAALARRVEDVFYRYQKDWSDFNVASIQTYTTPTYFQHASIMLAAMRTMGRRNVVDKPKLIRQIVSDIYDDADNAKDRLTVMVQARANDRLVDMTNNANLFTDRGSFVEFWYFVRQGDQWLLDRIQQATEDANAAAPPLQRFASENGMYYSLDWGWLLLPKRGQLFSGATFGQSDINNHVIGVWNGIIVQLYTYIPFRRGKKRTNYFVGQITVPKQYGHIIIERKGTHSWSTQALFLRLKGYRKYTFEWPDFNKHYTVYATDADRLASFELLNPKFMTTLYDFDMQISIEVVDNVVYLYSRLLPSDRQYVEMLEILRQAYRELKL